MRIMTRAMCAFFWCAGLVLGSASGADRPNIVLIMADDMGYECVGANGGGPYKTPHLDKLAAGGVRFEHCHSQPICTPTRVQIMTGLYNSRNYIRFGVLDPKATTFANILRDAGYATCIVGKWQLKGGFEGPNKFGFDEYCLWQLTRRPNRFANPGFEVNGNEVDHQDGSYGPDIVTDYACDFIERQAKADKPFLLYYPMMLPHWPFDPTPDSKTWDPEFRKGDKIEKRKPDDRDMGDFVDMVAYTDKMVGRIVAKLKAAGVADNTLVIFTGDNGTYSGITSTLDGKPYPGGKGKTTDNGTRVPLVVDWPGKAKAGSVCRDLVDFSDVLPTLLDAAGVKPPAGVPFDGRSFLPQVRGEAGSPRDWIYCWYYRDGLKPNMKPKHPGSGEFARDHRYKYYRGGAFYDVKADPTESRPLDGEKLTDEQKQARDKLRAVVKKYTRPKAPAKRPAAGASSKRPNVVLMLGDDHTYTDAGCYGNADVKTPNIDRLASQGMRFTRCFTATAMCAPTRQQLYTGIFPVRNGAYPNHSRVRDGTKSLGHHFASLGYRVGLIGKKHYKPAASFPFENLGGRMRGGVDGKMAEELPLDRAASFINRDKDQPYFLIVASDQPHKPWTRGDASAYDPAGLALPPYLPDTPTTRRQLADYYAEITYLDAQIGRVLELVERSGRADDTIFLFTSEQGSNFTHCKWTCYETGLRTMLVARWPGRIEAGSTTDAMVQYVDVVPTLLEAAGADPTKVDTGRPGAAGGGSGFDGRSFLGVLLGKADAHHEYVFGIHTTRGIIAGSESYPIRSVRDARFKYIRNLSHEAPFKNIVNNGRGSGDFWDSWVEAARTNEHAARMTDRYRHRPAEELYDLANDPFEMNNLAGDPKHRERMDALGQRLDAWMAQQGDRGVATEMEARSRQK